MDQFSNISSWALGNVEPVMFYVLAALAIPLAFGVIMDKVIIRAGFLLIGVFGIIAGIFFLLQAQFLALAQVMIYAVGITLVVVIALMLTNPHMENESDTSIVGNRVSGLLIAVLTFLTIYLALRSQGVWINYGMMQGMPMLSNINILGYLLMTIYSLPFEFASLLLLAALMGAVMLAKIDKPGRESQSGEGPEQIIERNERIEDVVKI